jgi:hypothetical protein
VQLEVAAIAKALLYLWEVSTYGKTFTKTVDTEKVTAVLTGLTPGQTYYFRFHAFVRGTGYTNHSQIVTPPRRVAAAPGAARVRRPAPRAVW